ncbi:4'-phosphopantetheinyl transferase superfamily protein, partial [Streptomyces sp. NPDC006638]|uniref:4'-phosphopantetheinyl transferase family protein n=1 Tax=Streptomyces sp. NPDC006638 TaxID=3157183 RepID=UPI0033A31725
MRPPPCDVWWARTDWLRPQHLTVLGAAERERLRRYRRRADRDRCALGAVLLRAVAARALGSAPGAVAVVRSCPSCPGPHGRPVLPGTGLYVSTSHSGAFVVVAATRAGPVGVDVEEEPAGLGRDLRVGALGPEEAAGTTDAAGFVRCWARKEALLKAVGVGITVPLAEVDLGPPGEPPRLRRFPGARPDQVYVTDLPAAEGYAGAVCVLAPGPVPVRHHDAGPLLRSVFPGEPSVTGGSVPPGGRVGPVSRARDGGTRTKAPTTAASAMGTLMG